MRRAGGCRVALAICIALAGGLSSLVSSVLAGDLPGACDAMRPGERLARGDDITIAFRLRPVEPAVGQMFDVETRVCDAEGEAVSGELGADAVMPAHGHGMNYRPATARLVGGQGTLRGFVFHMPGTWRIRFTLRSGESVSKAEADHHVAP